MQDREEREVGGKLVSRLTAESATTQVEMLARRSSGHIFWRYCQPRLTLLWFRNGIQGLHLEVEGHLIHSQINANSNFVLLPAWTRAEGDFDVSDFCDYALISFNLGVAYGEQLDISKPLIGFGNEELQRSLPALCREAQNPDKIFPLYADGWAMQTLAILSRIPKSGESSAIRNGGGLAPAKLRRVIEFIRADMASNVSVEDLARIAGISPRHFIRAFHESVGQTPAKFVLATKVDHAKYLLANSDQSALEIAINCGFCHAQHFSTAFKKLTGCTPSAFRKMNLVG